MFKTKVLNKHLALALTSGLLLMANVVNAEPYIGSITPDNGILKGNNVVVTQDTTGSPVFFAPSKYVVGDGSGTLTVNTNDTLGSVIFRAPDNNDQVGEGVNLKGNLVLNVNLKPRDHHESGPANFGGADKPWMSVNIDGNFELNATFNSNDEVPKVSIPYFHSEGGQSSFSVTGDVKISVVTIAPNAKVNASTQAFTFSTDPSSSEEAKKTVNVGNPNSTFSLFTAYFKNPDNYDKADTMAGANGVYASGSTDINIKAGKKVQIISVADYADAISAKKGGRVDLGSPEMLQVIGVVDFFNTSGSNDGAATETSRQSRISGTFQGNNSFWFGDEKVRYTDKNPYGQHGGDLNFTFKDGAEWIYMVNPRLTKITLEDGGAVNMYDDYVLKLWQEKVVDPKTDLKLPEQASLADFWPSVIKDQDGRTRN